MPKPITIIGGGLSGLVLGILLRKQGIPVVIHEAGHYPRHKVCGEFISGRGIEVLQRLDLLPKLKQLGTRSASTLQIFADERESCIHSLPNAALCVSRYQLDQMLATEFVNAGGDLQTNSRSPSGFDQPGVVRATGRIAERQGGEHVMGLKMHARNLPVSAGLEMHFGNRAYLGLCEVEDGLTNICGLFRVNSTPKGISGPGLMTALVPEPLRVRMLRSQILPETFCTVAALPLVPRVNPSPGRFAVGDSITMLPPATGNGMSFAFESANLAAPVIADYARGKIRWDDALIQHSRQTTNEFSSRVRWARIFHRALFNGAARKVLFTLARRDSTLVRFLLNQTR